jgi:hypothetical protein
MGTSSSINWNATRDDIIKRALRIVGGLEQGQSPEQEAIIDGSFALNAMIKAWQGKGLNLWKVVWSTATLIASSEVLGDVDGLNYTCIRSIDSLPANGVPDSGADYTKYWKQTGSSGVAVATATTAYNSIGDIDLTNDILGITEAFWRDGTTDTRIDIISRKGFYELSDKTTSGQPSKLYLDTSVLSAPRIYLWPQPNVDVSTDLSEVLHYGGITRLEDFDAGINNPDFDPLWIEALIYNLADRIAPEYGYPANDRLILKAEAKQFYDDARGSTTEDWADLDIQVDIRRDY